jgi:hypothetical protein
VRIDKLSCFGVLAAKGQSGMGQDRRRVQMLLRAAQRPGGNNDGAIWHLAASSRSTTVRDRIEELLRDRPHRGRDESDLACGTKEIAVPFRALRAP